MTNMGAHILTSLYAECLFFFHCDDVFMNSYLNQLFVVVSMNYCYVFNTVATTANTDFSEGQISSYLILVLKRLQRY